MAVFLLPNYNRTNSVKIGRRIQMEENLNVVNDTQTGNVDGQVEQVNSESVNTEVAAVQNDKPVEKPVQTPEQNAEFARVRREAETKAKDAVISEMYGESHGIHTYAEYQAALAREQAEAERAKFQEENGIDPESLKPVFQQWKESDPDFQELKAIRAEKNQTKALTDLNNELKDAGVDLQIKDLSNEELSKLPNIDGILEQVQKGHTLADAYFLANKKDIISRQAQTAQQEAIKKIAANGASSPGSLSAGGESDFISQELFESKKNDQRWVIKNLSKIQKSRANW